jgi:hypothetical protein
MATKKPIDEKAPEGAKTCFVVSPIGEEGTAVRKHADQVLKHIVKPVVEPLGYRVVRADDVPEPGMITNQIVEMLIDADLVVADLTGHNPNVFYELALRHGLMKPVVQMIKASERLPFDVAGARAIFFDLSDLDAVDAAREQLRKQVTAVDGGARTTNPFSVVFELRALSGSENPDDQFKATVLRALDDLSGQVQALAQRRGDDGNAERARVGLETLEKVARKLRSSSEHCRSLESRIDSIKRDISGTDRPDSISLNKHLELLRVQTLLLAREIESSDRDVGNLYVVAFS